MKGGWAREANTFLSFSQTDIRESSGQVTQTLIVAGLLVLVGHDCDFLLCISGFGISSCGDFGVDVLRYDVLTECFGST